MTIGGLNATAQTGGTGATGGTNRTGYDTPVWRQRFGEAFEAIAAKLGMTKSALIAELKSGKRMKDIEQEKGVSKDDVIAAAASALRAADPKLSADAALKLATSYYDGKAGHYHHEHHDEHHLHGRPVPRGGAAAGGNATGAPNRIDVLS